MGSQTPLFPAQQLSPSGIPIVLFSYQLFWENEAQRANLRVFRERCCRSVHRDSWNGACGRGLPARGEQAPSSPAASGPLAHQPGQCPLPGQLGREGKTPPWRCRRTKVPPATSVFSVALTQTEHSSALQVSRYRCWTTQNSPGHDACCRSLRVCRGWNRSDLLASSYQAFVSRILPREQLASHLLPQGPLRAAPSLQACCVRSCRILGQSFLGDSAQPWELVTPPGADVLVPPRSVLAHSRSSS